MEIADDLYFNPTALKQLEFLFEGVHTIANAIFQKENYDPGFDLFPATTNCLQEDYLNFLSGEVDTRNMNINTAPRKTLNLTIENCKTHFQKRKNLVINVKELLQRLQQQDHYRVSPQERDRMLHTVAVSIHHMNDLFALYLKASEQYHLLLEELHRSLNALQSSNVPAGI